MWNLESLIEASKHTEANINGKWVPARPLNFKRPYVSLRQRIRDAWEVFWCRAEAVKWPGNQ